MPGKIILAVGQLGPIARSDSREQVVKRLVDMLEQAAARNSDFIVFPELALTTFFPRWYFTDEAELDAFYEMEMPNPVTRPLFEAAVKYGVGFNLGFAELVTEGGKKRRFNTSIAVDKTGKIVGKYRKVHLPGHKDYEDYRPFQHLEKRYFETGDMGFPVYDVDGFKMGMFICNDRRWPETWRVMGLKGAELICGGYNTPLHNPPVPQHDPLSSFRCRQAPTRTVHGPQAPARSASRRAACCSAIPASSPPPGSLSRSPTHWRTRSSRRSPTLPVAAKSARTSSISRRIANRRTTG